MNKVFLIGRLTADPTAGNTQSGKEYARFTLAINRYGSDDADFINIVAWDKTAGSIVKYMSKGRQIAIFGHIKTDSYVKDGVKRPTFDVVAESIEFVGSAQISDNSPATKRDASIDDLKETDDDDMPF